MVKTGRPGGERSLIESIRRRAGGRDTRRGSTNEVRLGIGDDCALIRPCAGEELAITTDFTLENVHFRRDWHPPESVGHRCLARGLSDLAAMGARPVAALLSLAVPRELTLASGKTRSWVDRFLDGFLALAAEHRVTLIGGDTAQSAASGAGNKGLVHADVVLLGGVKRGRALLRSGASPGDILYVTASPATAQGAARGKPTHPAATAAADRGGLGGSAAELLALRHDPQGFQHLIRTAPDHPHLYPHPRVAAGLAISRIATAAIDLSDGLSTDLGHLCEESHLSAELDAVPIHPLARHAETAGITPSALDLALHGGEDYELLFTASPGTAIPAKIAGVAIHRIGEMKRRRRGVPMLRMRDRGRLVPLQPKGWEHFTS